MLKGLDDFLESHLRAGARFIVFLSILFALPTFFLPLWAMSFYSNQYPDGLKMKIYISRLEGQKTELRDDLREINNLNHYIGMRPLLESDFAEFTWLPLVLGGLTLLALRAIVMGKANKLLDVFVLTVYFGLFSFWSFYYRLYSYGHNLAPDAPIKVEPFTPPLFGTAQIANFTVHSYPGLGCLFLLLFGALLFLALAIHFITLIRRRSELA